MGTRPIHEESSMDRHALTVFALLTVLLLVTLAPAAPTTVVLAVDGMT